MEIQLGDSLQVFTDGFLDPQLHQEGVPEQREIQGKAGQEYELGPRGVIPA
jgi:hypothetical protein